MDFMVCGEFRDECLELKQVAWHVLDAGSIWVKEFASALTRFVPTVNWAPTMRSSGVFESWEREEELLDPPLRLRHFPLQRGYSRFPFSLLQDLGRKQTKRMSRQGADIRKSPLICTTPFYAPVAENWRGPIIYYQTDLTCAYAGINPNQVRSLDTRMCKVAAVICPNSRRIAQYMVAEARCDPAKIAIVPNATREENVLPAAPLGPGSLPEDLRDLPRPIVGVLGNLAGNLDWKLLLGAVEETRDFSWAFIGPYSMEIPDPEQREARKLLLATKGRVHFSGPKPYGLLQDYARAFDVAVLPYRRAEPTYSGSSTRFYEHLAACRPILATRGFEELLRKEPLLCLVDGPSEITARLEELRSLGFQDGWEHARWLASRKGTWTMRAATLIGAIQRRWREALPSEELPGELEEMIADGSFSEEPNREFRWA